MVILTLQTRFLQKFNPRFWVWTYCLKNFCTWKALFRAVKCSKLADFQSGVCSWTRKRFLEKSFQSSCWGSFVDGADYRTAFPRVQSNQPAAYKLFHCSKRDPEWSQKLKWDHEEEPQESEWWSWRQLLLLTGRTGGTIHTHIFVILRQSTAKIEYYEIFVSSILGSMRRVGKKFE